MGVLNGTCVVPRPSLAGFQWFLANVVKIPVTALDPSDPVIGFVFAIACETVNRFIRCASPLTYNEAVYNLATDLLINYAQDTAQSQPPDYWAGLRSSFKLGSFASGVVANASDEGTSAGLEVIEGAKLLTFDQLQNLKTPYGRRYLGIAQKFGTAWGMT